MIGDLASLKDYTVLADTFQLFSYFLAYSEIFQLSFNFNLGFGFLNNIDNRITIFIMCTISSNCTLINPLSGSTFP